MKIALVEDEKITQLYTKKLLENQGYTVDIFGNGTDFLDSGNTNRYRLILLDLNLPDMTGFDICYVIREKKEIYGNPKILILSARKEQKDVNIGLKLGADDYVKKPFDDIELILRIKNLIEKNGNYELDRVKYKNMFIDFSQAYIWERGIKTELTNKEKDILHYFVKNRGLLLHKQKIYSAIWRETWDLGNKKLEIHIGKLKKKSDIIKKNLVTFKNRGYKLNK